MFLFSGVLLSDFISWVVRALGIVSADEGGKNAIPLNLYPGFKATHTALPG